MNIHPFREEKDLRDVGLNTLKVSGFHPKKTEPHRTVKLPDSLENRSSPPRSAGVSLATRGRAELKSVLLFPFFDWTVVILCARTGRFVAGRKEGGASGGH